MVLQGARLSLDGSSLQIVVTDPLDKELIDRDNHMITIKETISQMIGKQVEISTKYLDKSKENMKNVPDLEQLINAPVEYE